MTILTTREQRRELERQNAKLPLQLVPQPRETWGPTMQAEPRLVEVWRSREYLVQVFNEDNGIVRLTVCRTSLSPETGRWEGGITWDALQLLKRECGRGHLAAVEIYPPDRDLVNVASMRHLWVLPDPPAFMWKRP